MLFVCTCRSAVRGILVGNCGPVSALAAAWPHWTRCEHHYRPPWRRARQPAESDHRQVTVESRRMNAESWAHAKPSLTQNTLYVPAASSRPSCLSGLGVPLLKGCRVDEPTTLGARLYIQGVYNLLKPAETPPDAPLAMWLNLGTAFMI